MKLDSSALVVAHVARALAILVTVTSVACGTDVVLGGSVDGGSSVPPFGDGGSRDGSLAHPDADPSDAPSPTPFPNAAYDLTIAPAVTRSMCVGALVGMESAFASTTRDALGLTEGPIEIVGVDATHLDVRGAPIETGFLAPSVRLERGGGPGVPDDVWIGIGTRAENGPLGTLLVGVELEAHQSTLDASGFDGLAAALYIDPLVEDAQCVIGFAARFDAR